jgi:hypothetical protein
MRVNGPFFATSVDRPYVVKGRHELDTAAGQAARGSVLPARWSFRPGPRADAAEFTHRDRW